MDGFMQRKPEADRFRIDYPEIGSSFNPANQPAINDPFEDTGASAGTGTNIFDRLDHDQGIALAAIIGLLILDDD